MAKHKSARCSTGHDSGVMMPLSLHQRLQRKHPFSRRFRLRSGYSRDDLRSQRMSQTHRMKKRGGKSYFYQLVQYALAVQRERRAAKIAAKHGAEYKTPKWLSDFKQSIHRAGRALLGKR